MARYPRGVTPSTTAEIARSNFSTIPPGGDRGAAGATASQRRRPAHHEPAPRRSFTVVISQRIGVGHLLYVERDGRRFMLPADSLLCEIAHLTSCLGECADHGH